MTAKKLFILWFKKFWNMIFVLMAVISELKYNFNSSCIHCFQYISILVIQTLYLNTYFIYVCWRIITVKNDTMTPFSYHLM